MQIGIISDLHTEFWKPIHDQIERKVHSLLADADLILMAGDIGLGTDAINVASRLFPDKPVFLVAGNHEFYNGDYAEVIDGLRSAALRSVNVQFLQQEAAFIEVGDKNLRILGTTLWTDFNLHGTPDMSMFDARVLNDFQYISNGLAMLVPRDTLAWHMEQRAWLLEALDKDHDGPTVILTHHAPVSFAISPQFTGDNLSPCFASRMEEMLIRDNLPLVVWGHTHHCVDRQIETTRFVSNQTGYPVSVLNLALTETRQYGQVVTL